MKKVIEKFKNLKDEKKLLAIFGILSVVLLTLSATYAFFSYSKLGLTENTLTTGQIKFIYNESSRVGNGISLEDAMPIPDEVGKVQDKYFDFSVTGTTGTSKISYEVTARKTDASDDIDEYVKLYLTKVNNDNEQEKVLSIYGNLTQSTNQLAQNHTEKTLYTGTIPAGSTNYTENLRLRMWLTDGLEYTQTETGSCSDTTYTNETDCVAAHKDWTRTATPMAEKTFTVKVNVYANGEMATSQEIADANSVGINGVIVNTTTATLNEDDTKNFDYYAEIDSEATQAEIDITEKINGQTFTVEPITENEANTLKQVSTKVTVPVTAENNYYKLTIYSSNKTNNDIYVLKIKRAKPDLLKPGNRTSSTTRILDEGKYMIGLAYENSYGAGAVSDVSVTSDSISWVSVRGAGYGLGFPMILKPATTYAVTGEVVTNTVTRIQALYYNSSGGYLGSSGIFTNGGYASTINVTFTTNSNAYYTVLVFYNTYNGALNTVTNPKVVEVDQ